jgi:hypothetical protein
MIYETIFDIFSSVFTLILFIKSLSVISVNNGEVHMDVSEQRVIGSLLLLLGMTSLIIGLYTGQLNTVLEIVKTIFEASVAGMP